ncbi:MAG TPA: Mth938-like domain-containing protein [Geminicoccaceae bacterium]|nr:Mth938-like domain-containing protein [Geminicoccaceae bacterium]
MEVTRVVAVGRQQIQAYREGGFTVSGIWHEGSLLVMPERTLPWRVDGLPAVTVDSMAPIVGADPAVEILILGCGRQFAPAPPSLRDALRAHGIVVEAMATPAACRTYNVLLAEDRRVAAALIAV